MRSAVALVAVVVVAGLVPTLAQAGYAVQPYDGSTISTTNPTFLVYIGDGETNPQVVVSTSPDHSDYGFTGSYNGSCVPTTPFGEPHKFTCQLGFWAPLAYGTYYWAYVYDTTVNRCYTFLGVQSCYPAIQSVFSGPFKFTITQGVPPTAPAAPAAPAVPAAPSMPAGSGAASSAQQIFSQDSSGMVQIFTRCAGSSWEGSGFLIGPQILVTALHVLEPQGNTGCTATVTQDSTGATARVTNWSRWYTRKQTDMRTTDFATAKLDTRLTGYYFRFATNAPARGQKVIGLGYSLGEPLSLNQGHDVLNTTQSGVPILLMTLLGAEGSSGGPILNASGYVVGLIQRGRTTSGSSYIVSLNVPVFIGGAPSTLCKGVAANSVSTVCGTA